MKKKITPSRVLFNVLNYTFFAAFLILCAYPLWYVFIYTISDPAVLKNQTVTFLPRGFTICTCTRSTRTALPRRRSCARS